MRKELNSDPLARALRAADFIVGPRDARRKPGHAGRYMVAQPLAAGENAADNSAYCIVGDSLPDLVQEAARHFEFS
jgi:hypothetical protein